MKSWDVGNMQEQIDDFMRNWKKIKNNNLERLQVNMLLRDNAKVIKDYSASSDGWFFLQFKLFTIVKGTNLVVEWKDNKWIINERIINGWWKKGMC